MLAGNKREDSRYVAEWKRNKRYITGIVGQHNNCVEGNKKKSVDLPHLDYKRLKQRQCTAVEIIPFEAELDEQWSYVGSKANQRWLWLALDHNSHQVIAYTFGKRTDNTFLDLKKLLERFSVHCYYSDDWGSYQRHLDPKKHEIGKCNTQVIERKNLNFRTRIKRLARRTICFSKSEFLHDTLIGLFINRYEFGRNV